MQEAVTCVTGRIILYLPLKVNLGFIFMQNERTDWFARRLAVPGEDYTPR
ncbi:hypothetical protein GCWU000246_01151 [Jonquetella anthropi E3_33 E1]|nr:hypothetical protein GCWU000246_01151 [Jonquetella anthropi E3_33 E1]